MDKRKQERNNKETQTPKDDFQLSKHTSSALERGSSAFKGAEVSHFCFQQHKLKKLVKDSRIDQTKSD